MTSVAVAPELDRLRDRLADLEREAAVLRAVVEDQTEVVCRFRPDGRFLYVNDVFCRVFGRRREDLIDRAWMPNVYPDDLPHIQARLATLAPDHPVVRIENRSYVAGGELRWMEWVNRGFFTPAGDLYELQAVGRDVHDRKLAETALAESEARFRAFMDSIPLGAWVADAAGRLEFVNHRVAAMVGLPPAAFLGKTRPEFLPPDLAAAHRANDVLVLATGHPVELAEAYTRPDGSPGELLVVKFPVRSPGGEVKVGGVALDVTERRRDERALAEREAQLRALGDNIPGGAVYQFARHPDGRVEFPYMSAGAERVLGVTAARAMAEPGCLLDGIHPEDAAAYAAAEAESARRLTPFELEFRSRRPDGGVRWVHCRSAPRRRPDGSTLWDGVFVDTTDRHLAEARLRESEEHYRFLAESIPQLVWIYADGVPLFYNRRWSDYTGQTEEAALADRWYEALHPDDVPAARAAWEESRRTGADYAVEYRLRRHDGAYRWHLSRAVPLHGPPGRPVRWFGTCTDVHDAREAREELGRALRQREVLLKEVHHRVKNNLQVVTSLLQLQARRVADPAAVGALRDSQLRVRAMSLVHEMLYRTGDLADLPLTEYVRGLADAVARSFAGSSPGVRVELDVGAFDLDLDRAVPCGLILAELLGNCYKHAFPGGRGGRVRVEAGPRPGGLGLTVADDGVGPPPGGPAASLGLTLVADLAGQLGGRAEVRAGEVGTVADVWFPRPPAAAGG